MSFKTVELRRIATIVNGGTPTPSAENWGGGVPWATPVDLGRVNGGILGGTERTLTAHGVATGSTVVPPGSVLLSTRAPIGYTAIARSAVAFNQGCKALVPRVGVDSRFLRYAVQASETELVAAGRGSTFQEVNGADVAAHRVSIAATHEQRQIADYLDHETAEIDAFIADLQTLRAGLEARWRSVLIETVQGCGGPDVVATGVNVWPRAPRGWRRTRVKSTVLASSNGSWGSEPTDSTAVRCIRVADFDKLRGSIHTHSPTDRQYDRAVVERMSLRPGDLILEKSGGGPTSPVGNVVRYAGPGGDMYSNFVARVQVTPQVSSDYALRLHQALYAAGVTARSVKQTTGIQNLDESAYFDEPIFLPSRQEQVQIASSLSTERTAVDEATADIDAAIALANERRAALITAAVTGQIDVTTKGSREHADL